MPIECLGIRYLDVHFCSWTCQLIAKCDFWLYFQVIIFVDVLAAEICYIDSLNHLLTGMILQVPFGGKLPKKICTIYHLIYWIYIGSCWGGMFVVSKTTTARVNWSNSPWAGCMVCIPDPWLHPSRIGGWKSSSLNLNSKCWAGKKKKTSLTVS